MFGYLVGRIFDIQVFVICVRGACESGVTGMTIVSLCERSVEGTIASIVSVAGEEASIQARGVACKVSIVLHSAQDSFCYYCFAEHAVMLSGYTALWTWSCGYSRFLFYSSRWCTAHIHGVQLALGARRGMD